ncbi:MAG: inositol monophosphatase family protein [Armatimonadota bacterium]|nr:inositol monophosphatase family protein [Armatimonadota bacterium]MDR7450692.1 inositol monophosphatase family protein [Armatimonadota bacterium]MDR7466048.1 inositol monophosphatase family protein [Armatimonadota bacterium]MDR7493915.1 inositol monophosphatase family protein [Armatimonadota bacterium]MDR7504020.1 inositol monophosphatase family protein [Armatimonadota bacterium]
MASKFVETAVGAAQQAGELLLTMLPEARASKEIRTKRTPADLVTRADRMSEDLIVGVLRARFPDHGILAEEGSFHPGAEYRWIIDPLDGTTNFAHGLPLFCVSIGLEHRGRVIAGVVFHPPSGELFYADRGKGAFLRRAGTAQRLRVSRIDRVAQAVVATGLPYDIRDTGNNIDHIGRLCRTAIEVRILGAAALHLAYVAAGRLDAFWEPALNPWDIAAGALLVEEAGGRVTHMSGTPFDVDCRDVLASNGSVHDEMVKLLGGRSSKD